MDVQTYRDLRVWQAGMELTVGIYALTKTLPESEVHGLSGELQRAATAIPANIADGHARGHLRDYLKFLAVARSSLAEVATYLELVERLDYASPQRIAPLHELAASLDRQLMALRDSLAIRLQEDPFLYESDHPMDPSP